MAGQKADVKAAPTRGVRIPGFNLALHRGMRAVAARKGIPARRLYEQIVQAYLASVGEPVA
jgi:hypothetical protein